MAQAKPSPRKFFRLEISPEKGNEILGVGLAFLVVFLAASLISHHPFDPSVIHHSADLDTPTHNWIGPVGAQISALLFTFVGFVALLLPVLLGISAWQRFKNEIKEVKGRALGVFLVFASLPAMLQLLFGEIFWRGADLPAGGALGVLFERFLVDRLNPGGTFLVLLAVLAVGTSLALHSTLGELLVAWRGHGGALWERVQISRARRRKHREEAQTRERARIVHLKHHRPSIQPRLPGGEIVAEAARPAAREMRGELELPNRVIKKEGEGHFSFRKVQAPTALAGPRATPEKDAAPPAPKQETLDFGDTPAVELPPINLLETAKPKSYIDEEELLHHGVEIRNACSEFGVDGTVEGITPGPVITTYELQPAPGVKVSKVVNLQDDLALKLKAESVRIDRLAGRSTLGIEVPNRKRSVIHLGSLLTEDGFKKAPSPLTMAIGVDIHGQPHFADLATMPHLLVAGATGAGKSVGLQAMITSILYKATRDEAQFIFIDPKRIELGVYADIPHLKTEVVVEPKKAANALRWAVSEMERRYRLLAEVHVRSIAYYNRAISDPKERQRLALKENESEFKPEDFKPLPYYVIVIDELADLMMVASSEVETSIARLAQMARAVGIHLIVATQRPSVDVLTGTIKANFPCRLAFATATRHDSRTILDQVGAEKLLGKGDALFMPPGTSRIQRLHGAYISEQETASLIRWLKRRGKPDLDLAILEDPEEKTTAGGNDGLAEDDPLFDEAARLVVRERQASASYLQRRLRVGFSRAARLVDLLEADGLLGPAQGSKSRDVLVPPDYFDEVDSTKDPA